MHLGLDDSYAKKTMESLYFLCSAFWEMKTVEVLYLRF